MIGRVKFPFSRGSVQPTIPAGDGVWTEGKWLEALDIYQRSADWLPLPTVNIGEEKMVLLHAVYDHDSNFCAFNVTGSNGYIVDWGDGNIENFASGIQASHKFDYNYAGFNGTITSAGYKQAIITITPQIGGNLLTVDFNVRHTSLVAGLTIYSNGILDCKVTGANFTSILFSGSIPVIYSSNLERFEFIGPNNITSGAYMFQNCFSLGKIVQFDTSKITIGTSMFQACYSMFSYPLMDFGLLTDGTSMFNGNSSLITIPFFDLHSLQNATDMFRVCYNMTSVPLLNLISLTTGNTMFFACGILTSVPLFDLRALTSGISMFQTCSSMLTYPLFNLSSLQNGTSMFAFNYALRSLPLFDLSALTNGTSMFQSCSKIRSIPLFNLGNLTNGTSMFQDSRSITNFPLFDLHSLTNGTSMFKGCYNIGTVPLFNLSALTNGTSMFEGTYTLLTVPLFNFNSLTNASLMFNNGYGLKSIPLLNLSKVTTTASMFSSCFSLRAIPNFDLSLCTNTNSMFFSCGTAQTIPSIYNLPLVTDATSMFTNLNFNTSPILNFGAGPINATSALNGLRSLTVIPPMNFNNITNATTIFQNDTALSRLQATGLKVTLDLTNCRFSKTALEEVFTNVAANITAQTLTITGNWGADPIISKATTGTTIGSTTLTQTNTSSLAIGMLVTGTGISDAKAVTMQGSGINTITRTAHGLPNGKLVYFASIVTTTGIVIKTPYYVVNRTADTFQVSLTSGGAPLTLTNNGTGTIQFPSFITAINSNINYTIDVPATATGSITTSNRLLNTSLAALKGWTITG
jgi:hypothetical protein